MTQSSFQLAQEHQQAGRLPEAEAIYRAILSEQPHNADALHLLGMLEFKKGRSDAALDLIQQAIQIEPNRADYHGNLGSVLASLSRQPEAIAAYQRALSLRPDYPQALSNLGNALRRTGQFNEAIAALRRAVQLRPEYFEAHSNLGATLVAAGDLPAGIASFRTALKLRQTPEAYTNLGTALRDDRQFAAAISAFRQALQLRANHLPALRGLADALQDTGELEPAIALYRQILATLPADADKVELSLGAALKNIGQVDQSLAAFRRSRQMNPSNDAAASNLLFMLAYQPNYDAAQILAEHRQWDRRRARPLRASIHPHQNNRDPDRRLKIGYVSPDFRQHATAFCTVPLLSHHDHAAFEIFCYAGVRNPDPITERLKRTADVWLDSEKLSDEQLAQCIRADGIDILIDLAMHMSDNRLLTFARKPAPVQVAWIAYPGTTGLETIDYRITDRYLDPPGQTDTFYSEKSIRLPDSFWCYDPLTETPPPVNPLPALRNGSITFGCLNNVCKLNDRVLSLWSHVLKAVPTSRLLLRCPKGSARDWALRQLNVEPQRVQFVDRQPRAEYLMTHHHIDVVLDTVPYNGHMTSLDALWMGVPVISLMGRTVVGRAGLSQLSNLGLPDLVARDESEFVNIAAKLAGDQPRLAKLRSELRPRMEQSPLMDAPRFARNVEAAYREMWRQWCAAAQPN
jgi:protein O-GlcNAc transferase